MCGFQDYLLVVLPFFWCNWFSDFISIVDVDFVIFSFFDDHSVKSLEPGEKTSPIRNDFSHRLVKGLTTVVGLVCTSKYRESFRPDFHNPELLHVIVVEIQQQLTVTFLLDLQLDVLLNSMHLRDDFIDGQEWKAKVAPQQNFCNTMIRVQTSQIVL